MGCACSQPLIGTLFTEAQSQRRGLIRFGHVFEVHGLLFRTELVVDCADLLSLLRRDENHTVASVQFSLACAFTTAFNPLEDHELAA